ncbi:MAG: glucose-1-phosphate thymidylyltransferase [Elusimicrobia bacterium]|nr:glucose-1-phosphate thymidylyltransferase [Elusimicrobiota bacterium]
MKALVLAGGKGTRLRPITHTSAKQLIPIANKPILFYGLEAIARSGIKEVGIVVGDTAPEIQQVVGDGSQLGLKITYIPQNAPLGLAHAVKISKDFIGKDIFLMYLGDNLLKEGVSALVEEFKAKKPNSQILVAKVPNPQQFGVVEMDGNDRAVRLVEKPKQPKSDLALVGVYLFDSNIFKAVNEIKPSARGELEITDAIQWLLDHGFQVICKRVGGWWKDTGRLEDLLEANRLLLENIEGRVASEEQLDSRSKLEGRVILEEGAQILHSTIRGPAIIGKNTRVYRSYIGPYSSIYHDVSIEESEIEHSIVLEYARIKNVKSISDSLIGQRVEVMKSASAPAAYRLMLGDSSRVEIP